MKIAITGKGGVGKTTLSALLANIFANDNRRVIAIDADPNSNLAGALGISEAEKITPLIEMHDLIKERTGAEPGKSGGIFTLNPKVDDIPDKFFAIAEKNIKILVMGTIRKGGSGCVCPENTFLRALLQHIILQRDEVVIVDMEAGVEHLGRGTAMGVNAMLIVVEPGKRSCDTAFKIRSLANDLRIKNLFVVANKVRNEEDIDFIKEYLKGFEVIGFLRFSEKILNADREGVLDRKISENAEEVKRIKDKLVDIL